MARAVWPYIMRLGAIKMTKDQIEQKIGEMMKMTRDQIDQKIGEMMTEISLPEFLVLVAENMPTESWGAAAQAGEEIKKISERLDNSDDELVA
jgi:hypothetical protein